MWKVVIGVSSKLRSSGLLIFLIVSSLRAQLPDYDLNLWTGNQFEEKSKPFFEMLSLQTTTVRTSVNSEEGRLVFGLQFSGAASSGGDNLVFAGGKGGIFPAIEGSYWVARNLRLHGTFAGFESAGDIVLSNSYGFAYQTGGEKVKGMWSLLFLRSRIEGPDDFFFKSIVVSAGRRINYKDVRMTLGTGFVLFNSGIHIAGVDDGSFPKRMEGTIGMVTLRGDKEIYPSLEAGLELRLSPTCASVTLGLYGIL